jgi:hypothetical protein
LRWLLTGNRLVYRPLIGVTETLTVGIARARNGDLRPAGESFARSGEMQNEECRMQNAELGAEKI